MKRNLANFENQSVRLIEFSSEDDPAAVVMTGFRAEKGAVEIVESEITMSLTDIQTRIEQALANGVAEVDEKELFRTRVESKQKLGDRFCERDGEGYRLRKWKEVSNSVPTLFANNPQELLAPYLLNFRT